jgi:hypothetical protein
MWARISSLNAKQAQDAADGGAFTATAKDWLWDSRIKKEMIQNQFGLSCQPIFYRCNFLQLLPFDRVFQ